MHDPWDKEHLTDHSLLLVLFILLLFSSPILAWWSEPDNLWYLPYLIWFGIILLIAWVLGRQHNEP
ncbi:MAG: hypothetical protein ABFS39_08735 [Pseudomonadota bacterium]